MTFSCITAVFIAISFAAVFGFGVGYQLGQWKREGHR
jgi:hypothetical protein